MLAVLFNEWDKIRETEWVFRADLLAASLFGAVLLFFLDAYGWHLILKALGNDLPAARTMQVWLVSSLARYIPGGVWSYASRVALAKAEGISVAAASVSLYLETLLLLTSSLAIGLLAVLWGIGFPVHPLLAGVLWIGLGLLLHPRVLLWLKKLPGRAGLEMQTIVFPDLRRTLTVYFYYLFFWVLFGFVFVGFVAAAYPIVLEHWVPVGASVALGFFAGFVIFFVPGGIGVRESVLYLLLLPFMPASVSLIVSVASRLWLMAAEGISIVAILLYGRITAGAGGVAR
jgi:uncharacterized membrane protein YbhN (UPF0104 family)